VGTKGGTLGGEASSIKLRGEAEKRGELWGEKVEYWQTSSRLSVTISLLNSNSEGRRRRRKKRKVLPKRGGVHLFYASSGKFRHSHPSYARPVNCDGIVRTRRGGGKLSAGKGPNTSLNRTPERENSGGS